MSVTRNRAIFTSVAKITHHTKKYFPSYQIIQPAGYTFMNVTFVYSFRSPTYFDLVGHLQVSLKVAEEAKDFE
jgi:hypothetical protein